MFICRLLPVFMRYAKAMRPRIRQSAFFSYRGGGQGSAMAAAAAARLQRAEAPYSIEASERV